MAPMLPSAGRCVPKIGRFVTRSPADFFDRVLTTRARIADDRAWTNVRETRNLGRRRGPRLRCSRAGESLVSSRVRSRAGRASRSWGAGPRSVVAGLLAAVGPRLPRPALALFGPAGVALLAYTLWTRHGSGDGVVLYMFPVLWTAYFYGRKGATLIVVWVGVAHAAAVRSFPEGLDYVDRWLDVMVAVTVVAVVVQVLVRHADRLVAAGTQRGAVPRARRSHSRHRLPVLTSAGTAFRIPEPVVRALSPAFPSRPSKPISEPLPPRTTTWAEPGWPT